MSTVKKTNALRQLETEKIPYQVDTYEVEDGLLDGVSVADKVGKQVEEVFKTLVARGASKNIGVFVIPVHKELDLKKAAALMKEKNVEMITVKELLPTTGYIKNGCSPVGMKKAYATFIHESAIELENITVSAGKIGMQMTLSAEALIRMVKATVGDLVK